MQFLQLRYEIRAPSSISALCDNPAMSETPPLRPATRPITPITSIKTATPAETNKMLCERCGDEMYRMHAVWRCPGCGFKTDCCGW